MLLPRTTIRVPSNRVTAPPVVAASSSGAAMGPPVKVTLLMQVPAFSDPAGAQIDPGI
jgi:hypothetical protein